MVERRIFNVYKRIPLVGIAYGAARGVAYGLAGDFDEAKYSLEMDPADLNPLRMPRNIMNGLVDASHSLDKGIWIGKRTLGDQPFGLTFSPGADGYHWCIQIDGVIYELGGSKRQVEIHIISKNENPEQYNSYCKRFSWTMLQGKSSSVSETTLYRYAKSFESSEYHVMMSASGDKVNCQTFASDMFAKGACITTRQARARILAVLPNILF
ncbi:unnamed protein product [Rotaria magnacalcarata]|uniref:Uncharacterized protein n=3 Tax=Rotaria magnacalcarata TaxID=392030 RepID=A0A816VAR5_9BILA|nr:unnamed protein product [Rotaria magnacalcarata]CAF2106237.1 unnamed protein product [Rotaria magnacalcarata]CAF2120400.1 unnamed protein product [Rotaria magnacalcarata]CAF3747739.1 unnamed protein product [Rotaria magnacalcarata]CAF4172859.1 unnamed protein product [Rotaria magnacalcarata]